MICLRHGVMVGCQTIAIEQHFYWCIFKLLLAKNISPKDELFSELHQYSISSAILREIFMQINRLFTKLCRLKLRDSVIMPHLIVFIIRTQLRTRRLRACTNTKHITSITSRIITKNYNNWCRSLQTSPRRPCSACGVDYIVLTTTFAYSQKSWAG